MIFFIAKLLLSAYIYSTIYCGNRLDTTQHIVDVSGMHILDGVHIG